MNSRAFGRATFRISGLPIILICLAVGCARQDPASVQGYVEGEFLYLASPLAGYVTALHVGKGQEVKAGDLLFSLDRTAEQAARDEAEHRLSQARANLEDLKKGKRPSEMASVRAQLKQARAALALAEREFTRQRGLARIPDATTRQEIERAEAARDQEQQRVAQLEAELTNAQLGARADQILAAEAQVGALEAALVRAEWNLSQKEQRAPQAGRVSDLLYREGEWVGAGRPVVVLLPPEHVKVRAFVPEPLLKAIQPGDTVHISVDGTRDTVTAAVSFISPKAEYTPPVIYSEQSRHKLLFMIEATLAPDVARSLHPGQPVNVRFVQQ